eukprot:634805-Prymnesium_polylepis.1
MLSVLTLDSSGWSSCWAPLHIQDSEGAVGRREVGVCGKRNNGTWSTNIRTVAVADVVAKGGVGHYARPAVPLAR